MIPSVESSVIRESFNNTDGLFTPTHDKNIRPMLINIDYPQHQSNQKTRISEQCLKKEIQDLDNTHKITPKTKKRKIIRHSHHLHAFVSQKIKKACTKILSQDEIVSSIKQAIQNDIKHEISMSKLCLNNAINPYLMRLILSKRTSQSYKKIILN